MLAAVYHGHRDVRVENVAAPAAPGPGAVVIDVAAASVCGTDLSEYCHGPRMVPLRRRHPASGHLGPTIIGHEFTGTVAAVGDGVGHLRVGDRVVPGAGSWCGVCPRCVEGRVNLCERYFVYGLHAHGGMAEQATVPASMCHRVPAGCNSVAAAMAQPFAVALHAVGRAALSGGETIVVIGTGGIGGFIIAAAAARRPSQLIVVDINEERLSRAMQLGATTSLQAGATDIGSAVLELTSGRGADLVIEASGVAESATHAVTFVRPGGRVLLVGIQAQPVTLDLAPMVVHEIDLVTTNGHVCDVDLPAALNLLATTNTGAVLLGATLPLHRLVPDGLDAMAEHRASGKMVVRFDAA